MSVKNFLPTVWSARLLKNLDKNLVYGNAVNTEYEGEITDFGQAVKINQMGQVTVKDYEGALDDPEDLTSEQTVLKIDQKKYFNFRVDDVDAAQANVNLIDQGMERASYALKDEVDKDIASLVTKAGIKVGTASKPIEIDVNNAYDALVDLRVKLDENNVDMAGRYVILPPFYIGLLSRDPRFTKEFTILENGLLEGAKVAGFDIYMSNNVPVKTGAYSIMAGVTEAIAFAGQVTKIDAYSPEKSFADAVKGLYVYGREVVLPEALASFIVKEKTEVTE